MVISLPVPNFTSDRQLIFSGESINFTDASYNNPTSWLWTFPGGTPSSSTLRNPANIRYNIPGIYSVTLQASNPFGTNSFTKENHINVISLISCPFTWHTSIKATDAGNVKDSLKFGMSPQGTDILDTCLGESIIPPCSSCWCFRLQICTFK
ncbi:MAG: PKD domain-containing protein [Ignavibacteria bacterium]|nr:PKD domain-containing protein [Ignavibacteria bacterium]